MRVAYLLSSACLIAVLAWAGGCAKSATPVTVGPGSVSFVDISGNFAEQAIRELASLGVFNETSRRFRPADPVTRREFARWLVLAANLFFHDDPPHRIHAAEDGRPGFVDVQPTDPDFKYIQGLANAGFVIGFDATHFQPNAYLTREQMIRIKTEVDVAPNFERGKTLQDVRAYLKFIDLQQVSPQYYDALYNDAANNPTKNVLRVFGNIAALRPQQTVTRAEAALCLQVLGSHPQRSASDALAQLGPSGTAAGEPKVVEPAPEATEQARKGRDTAGPYYATVIASHPIAYWRMGASSLEDGLFDATYNGNNLIWQGPHRVSAQPPVFGFPGAVRGSRAMFFGTENGDFIYGQLYYGIPVTKFSQTPYSIEFWIRILPRRYAGGEVSAYVIAQHAGFGNVGTVWDYGTHSHLYAGIFESPNDGYVPAFGPAIDDGTWHYIAVTTDNDTLPPGNLGHRTVGYVDGVASYPDGYLHGINQNAITIAGEDNGGVYSNRPLPGFAIDEVALYTRLLTPEEIRAHYAAADRETTTPVRSMVRPLTDAGSARR